MTDSLGDTIRISSFHFQLYGPASTAAIRWRLLSGNNRDMGRGVVAYRDAEACGAGIREILRRLDELEPVFIPDGGNAWRWFLRYKGDPIVSSGHAYDRKIRCREGQLQFLRHAPDAQIKGDIVVSTARRWSAAAVIDLRDPVDYRPPEQRFPLRPSVIPNGTGSR